MNQFIYLLDAVKLLEDDLELLTFLPCSPASAEIWGVPLHPCGAMKRRALCVLSKHSTQRHFFSDLFLPFSELLPPCALRPWAPCSSAHLSGARGRSVHGSGARGGSAHLSDSGHQAAQPISLSRTNSAVALGCPKPVLSHRMVLLRRPVECLPSILLSLQVELLHPHTAPGRCLWSVSCIPESQL